MDELLGTVYILFQPRRLWLLISIGGSSKWFGPEGPWPTILELSIGKETCMAVETTSNNTGSMQISTSMANTRSSSFQPSTRNCCHKVIGMPAMIMDVLRLLLLKASLAIT